MEGRYEFEGAGVLALVAEARAAAKRARTEAQRYLDAGVDLRAEPPADADPPEPDVPEAGADVPPGLWLMNDAGIYLRSNAVKRPATSRVHAEGYRAEVRVGDEPVQEFIAADSLAPLQPGDTLVVTLRAEKLSLSLLRPE